MGKKRQFFYYYLACEMKGKKKSCMLNERQFKKIASHLSKCKKEKKKSACQIKGKNENMILT
jgi:hypothetical protein